MRNEDGFTMVELLVTVVVIGILSAIALPQFTKKTELANDASAKSAASTANTALASATVEADTATVEELVALEPSLAEARADGRLVLSGTGGGAPVVVGVRAKQTETVYAFYRSGTGGPVTRFCAPAGSGGCGAPLDGVNVPGYAGAGRW